MSLKNKVIIFLGNTRFDSEIQATSLFIARNLAKDNKVFFIDYPFTLKDYFKYKGSDRLKERKNKFSIFSDGLVDTDLPNLKIVITPPVLPVNFLPEGFLFRSLLKFNEWLIALRLKKIIKQEHIKDLIYINSFNFHYPNIASHISPALTIYHCVDPMIVPYDMKHGILSENQLVKQSDLVICTSKALYKEKIQQNPNTYFVPNATDSEHANVVLQADSVILKRISELPKPIVGYLGTIERRINYDLLQKVVDLNPDKSFVLAGPVTSEFLPEKLVNTPNIFMAGPIPYPEVSQMINAFNAAIIPFKKDEVSDTIFPIKLFEYMSAGKPVIVTDFNPDLKDFTGEMVDYCSDAHSFSEALNKAIKTDNSQKIEQRKALAKENTWEKRTEQIAGIISKHLS